MPDFPDNFDSLLEGLAKAADSLFKKTLYPPDFDRRDPAYQLAWIDQQIPLLEKSIADLKAQAPQRPQPKAAVAPRRKNDPDWLRQLEHMREESRRQFQESVQDFPLDVAQEQLIELKARRASLVAAMPQQLAPPAAKPAPAQVRAQKLIEITALEKEKATALATMKSVTSDQNILQGIERSYDDKIQKIVDTL